jgi:hypothetical protein
MIVIELKPFFYKGQECIGLHGPDTSTYHIAVKKIAGIKWYSIGIYLAQEPLILLLKNRLSIYLQLTEAN